MRKVLNFLAKAMAILCAILFVITSSAVILLFTVEQHIFDASIYKQTLVEQQIYARLPGLAAEMLVTSINNDPCSSNPVACGAESRSPESQACLEQALGSEAYQIILRNERPPTQAELQRAKPCLEESSPAESSQPSFMKNLTAKDWETILSDLLPPEGVQAIMEQSLDQVFAYLNGESDRAVLSMIESKDRLSGEAGVNAVLQILTAQPACSEEQIRQLFTGISPGEETKPFMCKPPATLIPMIKPGIAAELQKLIAKIPDQVEILPPPAASTQSGASNPAQVVQTARMIMRLSPILPIAFLLGVTIFAVRSLRGWLLWWGIPLLIVGLIGIVFGLVTMPMYDILFIPFLDAHLPQHIPAVITDSMRGLVGNLLHSLVEPMVLYNLILAVIGLAMIVISLFIRRKAKREAEETQPPEASA